MPRLELLHTTATRALGVEGRSLSIPIVPSTAAIARCCRYFDVPSAMDLQVHERSIAMIWDALMRGGAQPTFHQVAMLVDATALDEEKRERFGGDYVIHLEPGDPKPKAPAEQAEEEGDEVPSGPVAGGSTGAVETMPPPPRRLANS